VHHSLIALPFLSRSLSVFLHSFFLHFFLLCLHSPLPSSNTAILRFGFPPLAMLRAFPQRLHVPQHLTRRYLPTTSSPPHMLSLSPSPKGLSSARVFAYRTQVSTPTIVRADASVFLCGPARIISARTLVRPGSVVWADSLTHSPLHVVTTRPVATFRLAPPFMLSSSKQRAPPRQRRQHHITS